MVTESARSGGRDVKKGSSARGMYAIEYVGDDDLPAKHQWAIVRLGPRVVLYIKESAVCPKLLEEAWAGFRHLEEQESRQPQALPAILPS